MTVYPDLAFFLWVLIYGAVFHLSIILLELQRSRWEFVLSVLITGFLSAGIMIPSVFGVVLSLLTIPVFAFFLRGKTIKGSFKNLCSGLLVYIFFWGFLLCFSGLILGLSCVVWESFGYFHLSFLKTVIAIVFSYLLLCKFFYIRKKKHTRAYGECNLYVEGKSILFRSYIDTGNFLSDPVSGEPVVVLEYGVLKKAFGGAFPRPMTYEFALRFSHRARVIPYHSVSGDGQVLSAFVPERFTVNGKTRKVVVAVIDRPMESRGQYSGIIGPDLIEGE